MKYFLKPLFLIMCVGGVIAVLFAGAGDRAKSLQRGQIYVDSCWSEQKFQRAVITETEWTSMVNESGVAVFTKSFSYRVKRDTLQGFVHGIYSVRCAPSFRLENSSGERIELELIKYKVATKKKVSSVPNKVKPTLSDTLLEQLEQARIEKVKADIVQMVIGWEEAREQEEALLKAKEGKIEEAARLDGRTKRIRRKG